MSFKMLAALFAVSVGLTGCTNDAQGSDSENSGESDLMINKNEEKDVAGYNASVSCSKPDSSDCSIEFSEGGVAVTGGAVDIKGTTVTISRPGVYSVKGGCSDGRIVVDPANGSEITLVLNGVDLTSKSGSVIECTGGKKLTLFLAEGSENRLSDTENYVLADGETEPDGAVYSKAGMIVAGSGRLFINAMYKDGIKCKDTLSIDCGGLEINSADDGIVGKDCVVIQNGRYVINAGGDGIKSTNSEDESLGYITINGGSFDIASESDGIQAQTALSIKGGSFKIVSGGEDADGEVNVSGGFDRDRFFGRGGARGGQGSGSSDKSADEKASQKGLKSGSELVIDGGEMDIKSADDGIHSNGGVTVNGGTLTISSCDDGIHADEALKILDGVIAVTKSYEGLEGKNIEIAGGNISIVSADDGLNAAGGDNGSGFGFNGGDYYINITGGDIIVNAAGDGVDSNGTIVQSGGSLVVFGPEDSGNGAIDYERSYTMSGGVLIALGSRGMAQAPGTLSQPCLSVYGNVSAGTAVEVRTEDGSTVLGAVTPKRCESLIFCCDSFKAGSKYSIYAGDTLICEVTATDGVAGDGASASGMGGFSGGFNPGGFGGYDPGNGGSRPDRFSPNNSFFY